MCTLMFITALFTIAKTWKRSKCSSTDEWIKEIPFIFSGYPIWASLVAQRLKRLPAMQETWVQSLEDGEGNGNHLQYSCLENPRDGGAWWAMVHGIAKSWTRLSDLTFTFTFIIYINSTYKQ